MFQDASHVGPLIVFAAGMLLWGWHIVTTLRFRARHQYQGAFRGKRYPCRLGEAATDHRTVCEIGADPSGIYLLPIAGPKWSWAENLDFLKQPMFLPWAEIDCRPGRIFFSRIIWFRLDAQKMYYFVPRDIGLKLLRDAGRSAPE